MRAQYTLTRSLLKVNVIYTNVRENLIWPRAKQLICNLLKHLGTAHRTNFYSTRPCTASYVVIDTSG